MSAEHETNAAHPAPGTSTERAERIDQLRRERPRGWLLRWSAIGSVIAIVAAWASGNFLPSDLFSDARREHFSRFVADLEPFEIRELDWGIADLGGWMLDRMNEGGWEACALTLAIAIAAIVVAGVCGAALSIPAARTLATAEPYLPTGDVLQRKRLGWWIVRSATRFFLVLLRSVPEYLWAFLLISIFGISALPAVLALAIHNTGILGKLDSEALENLPSAPLVALRAAGASRMQIALFAALPAALSRYLLFFFYRWETCVREATVLGMLSIFSLGSLIVDARVRLHSDRLLFYALLGCALVLVGDVVSLVARRLVRDAK